MNLKMKTYATKEEIIESIERAIETMTLKLVGFNYVSSRLKGARMERVGVLWRAEKEKNPGNSLGPVTTAVLDEAFKTGEVKYLARVAKAVSREPSTNDSEWELRSDLEVALIGNWFPPEPATEGECLCYMTDPAIVRWWKMKRPDLQELGPDNIRKTWERLGLIKGKPFPKAISPPR
jgi:hypothetical protein